MIDHISLAVPLSIGKVWREKIHYDQKIDEYRFIGHSKNMKIKQTEFRIFISGSLAKFLNDENITPLTREQVKKSLEKLQDETGIDLKTAIIHSVEFETSIILEKSVCLYLKNFDYMPKYTRHGYGKHGIETIGYDTPTGSILFHAYDKTAEKQAKKEPLPLLYQNSNVMRLEHKIKKRRGIRNLFKKDLHPFDLAEQEVYRKLAQLFYNFYTSIPKTGRQVFIDTSKKLTCAQFQKLTVEQYRHSYPDEYSLLIQNARQTGALDKANYKRIQAVNKKNGQNNAISSTGDLIAELDKKVTHWAFFGA